MHDEVLFKNKESKTQISIEGRGAHAIVGTSNIKRWFLVLSLLALLFSGFAVSCNREYSRFMKLPVDPAVTSTLGWGVVSGAYASVRAEPRTDSKPVALLRGGTVFACLERRIDAKGEYQGGLWYLYSDGVTKGWLHDSDVKVFTTEEQARKAALSYR